MKNKKIKLALLYYSFCVVLSVIHFAKPRFDTEQLQKIVLEEKKDIKKLKQLK